MRKKCYYGRRRTWVNIAVCPCLHSFLSHNKHHSFGNKVWEIYIFIKKYIRRSLKSPLTVNDVSTYICICIRAVWFCGISTFVGYLTPNPFLSKLSVLFKTIRFSMSKQFNCQKHFFQTIQLYITIQFSGSPISVTKIVPFKTIQFSKSTQFKCKYSIIVKKKNILISSYSVQSSNST